MQKKSAVQHTTETSQVKIINEQSDFVALGNELKTLNSLIDVENNGRPSTIDLIINKNVRNINQPISQAELNSDHNPIFFTINNFPKENIQRKIVSYKNTDWARYRNILSQK
ncbi:hypothetical protein HHI36_003543 [Cryptolaemus montrouzieri]|uniref:Endonuclease/exonuclease/phosphatase domain-containing protein n=1 Tax=Cryptolaemus montrouzieri TaxID=559131 RepID=A0ABD2PDQ8_9CUCU